MIMLVISLHNISISARKGVYDEEKILDNTFEVDVDISVPAGNTDEFPFVDYTLINKNVQEAFDQPHDLLEHFIRDIHRSLKSQFMEAEKINVVIRKLNPPMPGEVGYAQVCYEG